MDDLAVTLRVHPYNLLLEYEENGRFRVGDGIARTLLRLITNIAAAHDATAFSHLIRHLSPPHDKIDIIAHTSQLSRFNPLHQNGGSDVQVPLQSCFSTSAAASLR